MARIQLSGLLSDIAGKVGGSIFQTGQSGHIIRNLTYPCKIRTPAQENIRGISVRLHNSWINLLPVYRKGWQKYALYRKVLQKNSQYKILNGHQLFLKLNHYRLLYGNQILKGPSWSPIPGYLFDLELFLEAGQLKFSSNLSFYFGHFFYIIFLTYPKRASVNNPGSSYRVIIGDFDHPYKNDITDAYYNVYKNYLVPADTGFFKYTLAHRFTGMFRTFTHKKVTLQ